MADDILQTLGQGLGAFLTGTPRSQIKAASDKREQQAQIQGLMGAINQLPPGANVTQSPEFRQLSTLDPDQASKIGQLFGGINKERQQALFTDTREVRTRLERDDVEGTLGVLGQRLDALQKLPGADPSDTIEIFNLVSSGDPADKAKALDLLRNAEQVGVDEGFLTDQKAAERKAEGQKTATQKDFATFQDLLTKAKESGSEKDKRKAERFGRAARFIRETEQEKADIKVSQKEREAVAKANVTRKQGFIDSGIEAANGAASVSRALNLLDEVKTGGFDNLALKARRLFGIEGANEGELSNLMGKAVLAQLKPIFGAAFTAREGDALAALEAKFSNSAPNNKRLLENALKLINRAARRGIAAAEDQEGKNSFTANEIREALAFSLDDKISAGEPAEEPKQLGQQQPINTGRFKVEVL